ncbi:MAG: PEP motif anchor domain-containing [Geobacteraceae bacterium]|nr:MAG: PEP motif anchor domain-containing [Geobacteraceae bacterium]
MRTIPKEMSQILDERIVSKMKCKVLILFVVAALAALLYPPLASATPILGSDLASFTVLGASTVTNVPTSTIVGNVGVWPGSSITGFLSSPGDAVSDPQVTGGLVHATTALAQSAQGQLTIARTNLGLLGAGNLLAADLVGLTLFPGVYTVPAGATNLSGSLTLDGLGNANAAWVFQMPSTLITSPNSVVNVINTGSGAGLYWNVGSSATIDVNTTFMGNILALTSITMNTTATDLCGRALANTGAVTLDQNSLSGICVESLAGSNGLSGGLDVITTPGGGTEVVFLPFAPVGTPIPEPSTMLLLGSGLAGLVAFGKRFKKA